MLWEFVEWALPKEVFQDSCNEISEGEMLKSSRRKFLENFQWNYRVNLQNNWLGLLAEWRDSSKKEPKELPKEISNKISKKFPTKISNAITKLINAELMFKNR